VEATTWQTDQMPDRHRDPTVTIRPTADIKTQAAAVLNTHGWSILAALHQLLANPDRRIVDVEPYRPPPKPIGRPRKRGKAP